MGSNCSIKDKNNLFNHNVWSGGDYYNNLTGITLNHLSGTITSEWSCNGDYSLRFVGENTICNFQVNLPYTNADDELTVSLKSLSTTHPFVVKLYQLSGSTVLKAQWIEVPLSDNVQPVSITTTTLETITSIRLLVEYYHVGQILLVDDIRLDKR